MTPEEVFSQLGFNALEAEVYIALLKQGPQTAYKVAKLLNRPTANVYKAMDTLAETGAVEVEAGATRICRAIPIRSLTRQLQVTYKNKLDNAVDCLNNLRPDIAEEGIFRLQSPDQVFQRAREMLKRCRKTLAMDAFPGTLGRLTDDIEKLAARGIEVFVEAYAPVQLSNKISLVVPRVGEAAMQHWQAQQLNLAVDGKEMLVALFNHDLTEVVQANYSSNLYLSCLMYNGLLSEHRVHQFMNAKDAGAVENIRKKQKYFFSSDVPGIEQLFRSYKKD
jgi:sugar-specific transcriptional regulator TrmB